MKIMVKVCGCFLLVVCLLAGITVNAAAYELLGGHFVLTTGMALSYRTQDIEDQETLLAIQYAFNDWQWHLNSAVEGIDMGAYFNYTTNMTADITVRALPEVWYNGGLCEARTDLYGTDGGILIGQEVTTNNWIKADVVISTTEFAKMTAQEKKATISHEIGHVLGLAHNPDNGTIMYATLDGCTAYVPTLDDIQGVYAIYGDMI